ncbi:Death-associated protein 1 [Microtus ochrogaster]|uniref:Death-associated protein 1 n=1 Tax=Microtus ochrogaster TaxID=79684 RepID=A0A8J6GHC3_MICOH|nr:Death-associated protein 1 [Microtus ochrogaster]
MRRLGKAIQTTSCESARNALTEQMTAYSGSGEKGKLETKAGHPPAVKAGGMRIVQKHPHTGDGKEEKDKDEQEWESTSPPKPTVYISVLLPGVTKTFPQRLHKWPTRSRTPP